MKLPRVPCDSYANGYLCAQTASHFYAVRSKGTSAETGKVLIYNARCVSHQPSGDSKLFSHHEISHGEYVAAQVHEI